MATRTIANGGGNWNTNGTWVEGAIPTASDDVVATGTSGQLTIDAASACRSIDLTGYTNTLTHNAFTLTIGTSTVNPSNVALKFPTGMTYTIAGSGSNVSFITTATSVTQTVDFGGKTTRNITFQTPDTTSGYQLVTNGLTTGSGNTVTLTTGKLDTNNLNCSWGSFVSSVGNSRNLTLGTSTITITLSSATAWNVLSTSLTLSAASSTITLNAADAGFQSTGGALTYGSVSFTGSGNAALVISAGMQFTNVTRTGTAAKTDTFTLGTGAALSLTVTGTLTINGNSTVNRILVKSSTIGSQFTITNTGATVTCSNVDFQDIKLTTSVNMSAITGNSGDCQGNSGITFTTAAPQTWSGNTTGFWSTAANWTSRVPLPQDNVSINALTSGTITFDMPRSSNNLDCTGSTGGTLKFSSVSTSIYGNFKLASGMSTNSNLGIVMAGIGSYTITTAGVAITSGMTFNRGGGTWTLQDNYTCTNAGLGFTLTNGSVDFGGHNVTMNSIFCSGSTTRSLTTGSGTATLNGNAANVLSINQSTNLTLNFTGTAWIFSGVFSAGAVIINQNSGNTFTTVSLTGSGSNGTLSTNSCTIGTLNLTAPSTVKMTSGTTTTLTTLNATGSSGNVITISASTGGSAATLSKASGTVSCDWLSLQDSTATGGAAWYAGADSTNVSGNSGWIFTGPPGSAGTLLALLGVG